MGILDSHFSHGNPTGNSNKYGVIWEWTEWEWQMWQSSRQTQQFQLRLNVSEDFSVNRWVSYSVSASLLQFVCANLWPLLLAFDQWCLRCILGISWRNRISNEEVRRRTDQPPLTDTIRTTRLKYFGHIARADPSMDHSRALRASVALLPRDWKRRAGPPRHTWLRTVESDLAPLNIGLARK